MNKVRTRISWKIFLIFVSIILLFTALVYAMLIFFLPQFYYDYKIKQINDISTVLLQFAPYFILFAFILSLLTAYFFSRRMARPLLRMNKVASKMTNLNFTEVLPITSKDEIGQLSGNLNEMAINLEKTMLELNEVNKKLQKERQLEEMRKSFVTAISHELKSPLAAVMGQVKAMRYNVAPYDNHPKYLQESYQILEKMSQMIQEMLDVSKVDLKWKLI